MAKQSNAFQAKGFGSGLKTLTSADGTTAQLLFTAATDDSVIKSLVMSSNDTVDREVEVIVYNGTTEFLLGTVAVPAGSGYSGAVPAVDVLAGIPGLPLDRVDKPVLPMKGAYLVRIRAQVAITSGKKLNAVAISEDF